MKTGLWHCEGVNAIIADEKPDDYEAQVPQSPGTPEETEKVYHCAIHSKERKVFVRGPPGVPIYPDFEREAEGQRVRGL